MTNEEEMFKYEVILNGIYNKTKIEGNISDLFMRHKMLFNI